VTLAWNEEIDDVTNNDMVLEICCVVAELLYLPNERVND